MSFTLRSRSHEGPALLIDVAVHFVKAPGRDVVDALLNGEVRPAGSFRVTSARKRFRIGRR